MKKIVLAFALVGVAGSAFADLSILVYDNNTNHSFAQTAANQMSSSVTVANAGNFDTFLTTGTWDVVLIDSPSTPPADWTATINYVSGGGKVALSFWKWHVDTALTNAFGATGATSISLTGQTLFAHDSGFFGGVSMPNSDWHDSWGSDGAIFTGISGTSLAGLTAASDTVMFLGNDGRTIAMPLIDEAGDTWINDGSAVQVWKNAVNTLSQPVPEPATMAVLGLGALALIRRRRAAK